MREVLSRRADGEAVASTALDVYVHRLCGEIAAMTAALGRLDALVFTGGVGEHATEVRGEVAERLAYLGVAIDADANGAATGDAVISARNAPVASVVVTAREDLEIARQVRYAMYRHQFELRRARAGETVERLCRCFEARRRWWADSSTSPRRPPRRPFARTGTHWRRTRRRRHRLVTELRRHGASRHG